MDEQVIDDLYNRAVSQGYKKSKQEFIALLHADNEVFSDMYSYVKAQGYQKSPDDFSVLVGKKKGGTVSASAPTLSASVTKGPKFVEEQISAITPQLIGKEEESVVPQMNYQFGNLGFKFEETGIGDAMNVTAPNGKTLKVSLDPFTSSKETRESQSLQKFIRENTAAIPNLANLEKEYTAANKKFTSQKEVDDSITKYNQDENAYRVKSQQLLKKMNDLETERKEIERTPQTLRATPDFKKRVDTYLANAQQFQDEAQTMATTEKEIKTRAEQLNAAVGKYSTMKAEQGTWLGGMWNKALTGASRISSTAANLMTDLMVEVMPKGMLMGRDEYRKAVIDKAAARGVKPPAQSLGALKSEEEYNAWYNSLDSKIKDDIDNEIEDEAKKEVKYGKKDELTGKRKDGMLEAIRMGNRTVAGDVNTTPEWERLKSEGFWGGAVLGLAESLPAMVGGNNPVGWAQRTASMYSQVADNVNEEMSNNPAFDNVSESEKLAVTIPIGIAVGALEAYGLRNVLANKGVFNKLVVSALNKAGKTTTARTFGELVKNEVKSGVARGALTIVGGALAEAETGAAQEAAEVGIKEIYNAAKDKEMFNTPESFSEFVKDVAIAGAQEAVGGAIIGTLPAAAAAYRKQGFLGMSDEQFSLFEASANDTRIEKAFVASLKNSVNTGEMTVEQAKETLNDYRNAVGLFNSLPDNLDIEGKKKAMNLLREKRDLERQIDGKDEALTVPQRERVKAINEELTKISQEAIEKKAAGPEELTKIMSDFKDDENVVITVKTLEEVPEQFRDRAVKKEGMQVEVRETILGLPIGKKTTSVVNDGYTYTLTGKEIKDYAIQKQAAGQVPLQPTSGISEEMEGGKPQPKPEVVTAEGIQETITPEVTQEALKDVESTTKALREYEDKGGSPIPTTLIPREEFDILNTGEKGINEIISEVYHKSKQEGTNPELVKAVPEVSLKTQPEITRESVRVFTDEQLAPAYDEIPLNLMPTMEGVSVQDAVYEAYTKSKARGTNPKLVSQVEKIIYGTEQPTTKPIGPVAGNRLFSKPLSAVSKIADEYYQRAFGRKRPRFFGTRKLDEARGKRISDAFIAMKDDPNNPEVRAAYDALVKETIEQYKAFIDAGYQIEINNEEPYANSQEMIDDLRNNKRIKIFSTESGYGDNPITEQQRAENPLLGRTEFVDINGVPLLANDVFRAIHDFFGHAELGNSFGAKGEENAWNVHVRMFSPLAARAMTTETRGQNSYVNFSGVNDKITALREEARRLREEGKLEEAEAISKKIYEEGSFADQKMGLLPEEFSQYDEENVGDTFPEGEGLMTADTKDATTLERVKAFLDKLDDDLTKFGKETAGINIAIPVMKAIIKTVKALVATGITLQEAIRRAAAENNVTEKDVVDSINAIAAIRDREGKPQGVSEMELPGFNRMIGELEGVIEKSIERGNTEEVAMQNAINYLQGSKVYEDASDTQREQMVRDVRKMFGKREKAAPKPEKLFGEAKDVKMITMSEYDLLKKQLADAARATKSAKALWLRTSAALTKYLKQMVDGGYVSTKQVAAILRRFGKVNMFDEGSVNRFVDYMAKVFKNANYAEQIEQVNSKLPNAKKNAQTKVGVAQTLSPLLKMLFAINPTLIPDSVFDSYVEVVNMIGDRKTVLELEESGKLTDKVEKILDAVEEEVALSEELTERFDAYQNKLVDEDGKVDFAGTIKQMLEEEVITEKEAEIMRKYKKNIMGAPSREKKSEEELAAEKEILVQAVKESEIDSDGLPMEDERKKARELQKLIKTDAVKGLDNTQLKNLLRVIDNINNGFFPHFAQLMVERLNSKIEREPLAKSSKQAKPIAISALYSKLKSLLTGKDKLSELIRRNPLYYIDQVFGDYKTKDIYNSVFEKSAEGQSMFKRSVTELNNKLDAAEDAVAKSHNMNGNAITMAKFKMMTFMVQLEYESNPDNNKVNSAAKYLQKTIEHIRNGKSRFGERDADMLQKILNDYGKVVGKDEKGKDIIEIDNESLYKSFNEAEKKAIKTIQEINSGLRDKAIFTAAVIRGDKIHPLNNYVHLNVLHEYKADEALSGPSFVDSYNNSLRPSTKAKSLIARTGKVSPLNFDVFASASRGAKFVLMDYYLTEPIRTARKTINEASALLKEEKADRKAFDVLNAIDRAFEEAVDNLLTENFTSSSFGDKVVEFMSKQGYRAVLASLPRFAAELSSNAAFAMIAAPQDFKAGVKYRGVVMSPSAAAIMNNLASKQTNRLFPHDTLSGRLVDTSILSQASGVKGSKSKGDVANKIQQIYNLSLKKYQNSIELMADALIATPDKMVMRPMWFGAFANEFKKLTGKDVDFDKVAANDEKYMAANKEALDKARDVADQKSVLTGASDNAFMGVLKGKSKENQTALLKGFNMFNNFMTNFLIYEYMTARTGIMAAMGNGSISKKQGYALMAAVATRMTLYTFLSSILSNGLVSLFVDDEDEDDEKSILQKAGQAMASAFTSMALGRDFGNATKALVNQGIEYANEKYLDFLREGEYDPYKDAIQYTVMPPERKGKQAAFSDMIMNMMGPFGPSIKTAEFAFRKATEPPKKQQEAMDRARRENEVRLPLEILGNLGMIPLYKDVRKIVNKQLYKDIERAERKSDEPMMKESDMKKYYPELWKEMYGPGSAGYDERQLKKEMQKDKAEMNRQLKDEMYDYKPKKKEKKSEFGKGKFGGGKFGESKKKGGFGSSTFGKSGFGSK